MFCGFLEQDFARVSMLWGLGRLWEVHPRLLPEAVPLLLGFLQEADPQVRGLAAWCLGRSGAPEAQEALEALLEDDGPVELYEQEHLRRTSVGRLAQEALEKISGRQPAS
jgi:hypothetical protein